MVTDSRHSSTDGRVRRGRSGGVTDTRVLARGDELINVTQTKQIDGRASRNENVGRLWVKWQSERRDTVREESLREGRRGERECERDM